MWDSLSAEGREPPMSAAGVVVRACSTAGVESAHMSEVCSTFRGGINFFVHVAAASPAWSTWCTAPCVVRGLEPGWLCVKDSGSVIGSSALRGMAPTTGLWGWSAHEESVVFK